MSNAKKPADRKRKQNTALDRLRAEMDGSALGDMSGQEITFEGRSGTATVTILDPFDWDAEVVSLLRQRDYFAAICGMVSLEDGARLRAVRPTLGDLMKQLIEPARPGDGDAGESQAS